MTRLNHTAALFVAVIFSFCFSTANTALLPRLGGQAVYDTDLNITWLADAGGAGSLRGLMTWEQAVAFAASFSLGGATEWRLPAVVNPDPTCQHPSTSSGFGCTGSEMGHLFYTELGGSAGEPIGNSTDPDLSLFSNLNGANWWSGTSFTIPNFAWDFNFSDGIQGAPDINSTAFAWYVHDGDVFGACPFPDNDDDGVPDITDNCTLIVNPAQRDTDGDGFGNFCDPDFDNDGSINFSDLAYMKSVFFSSDPDADLDGSGLVNFADLAIVKSMFFGSPGPGSPPYVNPGYSTAYDFERIDPLGNGSARVLGVDDNGNVTGRIDIGGDDTVGFILDLDSDVITYVPELSTLFDLNNAGRGAGILWNAAGEVASCFIREIDGTLTPFSPPSQTSGYASCQGRGINSLGVVSGFERGDAGWIAFSYDSANDVFEEFLPTASDEQTFVGQVNEHGQIAGSVFYRTADQVCLGSPVGIYGFRRDANGFIKFFTIDGNLKTRARGIADNGLITGFFVDDTVFARSYVAVVSDGPGFENILPADYELLDATDCIADPGPVPYPAGAGQEWVVDADSYGAAIRNDGAVVGNCDGFYVLLDTDGSIIDFVHLGSAGFIATPIESPDTDGDSVIDSNDNCTLLSNANQRDTNGDGFGNVCDPDLDNNCIVDTFDLDLFQLALGSRPGDANWNPDADFDGDDDVDDDDLATLNDFFFEPPGPSGIPNDCDPT